MLKSYVRTTLVWLGLILSWATNLLATTYGDPYILTIEGVDYIAQDPIMNLGLFWFLSSVAIAFTMTGCFIWTRLKNRHWAFMLWGLLSPIGLLGVSLLKDKSGEDVHTV